MRLLVDTDAFCRLEAIGLFEAVRQRLAVNTVERLPALPQMLRRGRLRRELGEGLADRILPRAETLPAMTPAPAHTLDLLVGVNDIDPGEAQLLAAIASADLLLLTADKRAVRAVARLSAVVPLLEKKIVVMEAILLALCASLGVDTVRAAVAPHRALDKVFLSCFSPGNPQVEDCLRSNLKALQLEVSPLSLWMPEGAHD